MKHIRGRLPLSSTWFMFQANDGLMGEPAPAVGSEWADGCWILNITCRQRLCDCIKHVNIQLYLLSRMSCLGFRPREYILNTVLISMPLFPKSITKMWERWGSLAKANCNFCLNRSSLRVASQLCINLHSCTLKFNFMLIRGNCYYSIGLASNSTTKIQISY